MSTKETIISSTGMPLYKEVKRQVLESLSKKEWEAGDAIPTEKQLCARYGVSIGTLRKAIDELVSENILIRHQGRGTFVAVHNRGTHLYRFFNVVRHDNKKIYPTISLVSFKKKKAEKEACTKLSIPLASPSFRFINIRVLDNEPVLADVITLPESLFPGLTESKIRNRSSTLYNLYQTEYSLNIIKIEERVRACTASEEIADYLNIPAGTPLLEIHRVAYSYNDLPVEFRISYVNTKNYEYVPSLP